jgi:glycosyltransferase involved in cell wall biosynthesis
MTSAEALSPEDYVRLRILFVVSFAPRYDVKHGGRVVAQLIRQLVTRHQIAVVYQRLPGDAPMDSRLAEECEFVRGVPMSNAAPFGRRLQGQQRIVTAVITGRPSSVSAIFSKRFARIVRDVAVQWQPDITQIEHDSLGYCLPPLEGVDTSAVLVCHEPGLGAARDLVRVTRGRRRLAHRVDAAAWRRYWKRTLPHADAVVTFTGTDAEALTDSVRTTPVVQIPLGIELPPGPSNPIGGSPPTVVFIGSYLHHPNIDAAMTLMRGIMPLVRRQMPGLRLTLVGDQPTNRMLRAARPGDEITGGVPSVTPYLDQAALLVLPIRLGGGMRVKLLEGLAAGKAVIASPLAVAGLAVEDNQQLRIAETDDQFAQAILELLADAGARERIAVNAREWACANLTWDRRVAVYEELYRTLRRARSTAPRSVRPSD